LFRESSAIEELSVDQAPGGQDETCYLCGLPLGRATPEFYHGEDHHCFCCPGCQQVFNILSSTSGDLPSNFRESELYQTCISAGIIPGGNRDPSLAPVRQTPIEDCSGRSTLELTFRVEGMWCPSCAWLIGEVLKRIPGVIQPSVSFFSDSLRMRYLPHLVTPAEIASQVEKLGYRVSSPGENRPHAKAQGDLLVRLAISAILTMNTMALSWTLYSGFVRDLTPTVISYLSYPLFLMTVPVIFYGGMPILKRAWVRLRLGSTSMDTLVAVSALAAFSYSFIQMMRSSIHLYFDTAAMLITIVLLGRYVETYTRERVSASFRELDEIGQQKVRLAGGRSERWVAADGVRPGDHFAVREKERVPLDGRVTGGKAFVDQSALTGEPILVPRGPQDLVMAGSLLVDGNLEVKATSLARESSLRKMAELMAEALQQKDRGEQLADSVSRLFAPAILAIAALTAFILWLSGNPANEILLRCLTILLISCPCALGVAIPLGKVAIVGLGRKRGILVRNPEALEQITGLNAMVIDKTGTMTEGAFALCKTVCHVTDERTAFSLIAAVEKESSHFLAREMMRHASSMGLSEQESSQVEEIGGLGIKGTVGDKIVFIGNRRLLSLCGIALPGFLEGQAREQEQTGMTVAFFGWSGGVKGFLAFGDPIRQGAKELVRWLKEQQIRVLLLSGDGKKTTEAVARSLGVQDYFGQSLPSEKAELIRSLQREGLKVGMAGDGVNDAGALAQADVAFAMGSSHSVTKEASDLLIPSGKPLSIADAFELSSLSLRTTRQNLSFAFLYNAIAIPVAAAGLLNPLIAVLAMFMSSLTVIGNTLRVSKAKASTRV
jgi:heavy metal translocating P-type ATPase